MSSWLWLRFLAGVLCAVLAVHLVVLLNNVWSWKFTLAASEYGHRVALVALVLLPLGLLHEGLVARGGTLLLLVSGVILLLPLAQARNIAARLPEEMNVAFQTAQAGSGLLPEVTLPGLWFGDPHVVAAPPLEHIYVGEGGESRRLLFHPAAGGKDAPCIVVLHGGGWQNGSPGEFPEWSNYWSSQGYAVAALQYRLAPKYRWPSPREDVQLALDWLKSNAGSLGISGKSFILLGRSAGGQIATACAYGLNDPAIVGCISIYGPADLVFARRFAFADDVLNSLGLLQNYLGGDPDRALENYESASGYMLSGPQSCPTLLIHGTRDVMVWNMQSRRLAARLTTLGVPNYLLELPWGTHGFDWPFDTPGGQLTRYAVDAFLKAACGKPAAPT